MSDAFSRQGFDVTLLARKGKGVNDVRHYYGCVNQFKIKLFPTINLPGISFLTSVLYLLTILRARKAIFYGRDIPSLFICSILRKPFFYESHGVPHKWLLKYMEQKILKSTSLQGIIYISQALKGMYENDAKSIVLHDSADEPKSFDDMMILKGGNTFNAVYVGSLYPGRGTDLIYEMASRVPEVGFHLFGGTETEVTRNEEIVARLGLGNVYFYGYVAPSDVYKCRNSADVLLMPYQKKVMTINNASETSQYMSPLKMFEYMSSRKPIMSSNHEVLKEVLESGRNALLCDPNNVEEWVDSLKSLLDNKELCETLSENAYHDYKSEYTWDQRASRLAAFFE
ncbi:glycosyltransferase [Hahella ganghwensis]|uniref:glycosyltransferase n=1 Tax=Hahella ganghwensis TaxID=286420 RepID=UPI0004755D02|nr:glycosyltransferase [Hahella ganghwensis]